MNNVTQTLETSLIAFANSLYLMSAEVSDLDQYYFGTDASSLVGALPSGSDPATTAYGGSLSKDEFIGGITLAEALIDFFNNEAVSTSAYIQYADKLINGSHTLGSALSQDVDNMGARLKALGQNLIQLNKDAGNIIKAYNASGLSAIMGSIGSSTVVYGCNLTQSKFVSGIVLAEQFQNFLNNSAVATGDYLTTISNFVLGS